MGVALSCYTRAGLPHAFELIGSLLDLYVKGSFAVQEGLHNLSISPHIAWRDRDKPLETKEIFTGYVAGPLVARSEPARLPLLPPQGLQTSSGGGGWEQTGSTSAGEVWTGQIWKLFPLFSSSAEG